MVCLHSGAIYHTRFAAPEKWTEPKMYIKSKGVAGLGRGGGGGPGPRPGPGGCALAGAPVGAPVWVPQCGCPRPAPSCHLVVTRVETSHRPCPAPAPPGSAGLGCTRLHSNGLGPLPFCSCRLPPPTCQVELPSSTTRVPKLTRPSLHRGSALCARERAARFPGGKLIEIRQLVLFIRPLYCVL